MTADKQAQMAMEGRPAPYAVHPSVFIVEEIEARGWTLDDLAKRMGEDFGIARLSLDFYIQLGPHQPQLRIGNRSAKALATAFGFDTDIFLNLERAWLDNLRAGLDREPESFGYQSPTEEQNYGTADPIGFGDIEYPADVQPPKERA